MPPPTPEHFKGRRYYTLNNHLRNHFGGKVFKISLDAGFTCPTRDGTKGREGCVFCSARGSGDYAGQRADSLTAQFDDVRKRMHDKWPDGKYLAYFQAFSNTYAPLETLRERYEQALSWDDVVGLSIATRPDCLPEKVLDYLADVHRRTYLWVELGLQSIHPATATRIGRGYDYPVFLDAVERLRARGIQVCVHIIDGLPGEDAAMMRETAQQMAHLDLQGIKIHLLHILRDTPLAEDYQQGRVAVLEKEAYIATLCDQLELLPPEMVIHRLTGDGPRDLLLAPLWSLKKWEVLNAIDDELKRRDTWQGAKYRAG
jgi:uncharacterized protein